MQTIPDLLSIIFPSKKFVFNGETAENSISVLFQPKEECESISIAGLEVLANNKTFDLSKSRFIAVGKTSPPKVLCLPPESKIPRNCYPVCQYRDRELSFAFSHDLSEEFLLDILTASVPKLLKEEAYPAGHNVLAKKMTFNLSKDYEKHMATAKANKDKASEYSKKASEFLEAATRDEIVAENLMAIEKGHTEELAKKQWQELQDLIPASLIDVRVEEANLICTTHPIVLSGAFLGSYKVTIPINESADQIKIVHCNAKMDRNGCCHPHIKSDGKVCWGNLSTKLRESHSRKGFFDLVSLSLRLLNSYKEEDSYVRTDAWNGIGSRPEEGSACKRRGPTHSYTQAKKCVRCAEKCEYKQLDKYNSCLKLSHPYECVLCEVSECVHKETAQGRCATNRMATGVAYCMVKCKVDCPNLEASQAECQKTNWTGSCLAKDKGLCRLPCGD
jgi:hypothetical protein